MNPSHAIRVSLVECERALALAPLPLHEGDEQTPQIRGEVADELRQSLAHLSQLVRDTFAGAQGGQAYAHLYEAWKLLTNAEVRHA